MKTLLWIDDNEDLMNTSIPVFQKHGFIIIKATNTSRALSILREEKLDGALLDVRLRGGESGLELLEEIHRLYPTLKVAIFTGYPEYDDHIHAEEIGASAYLPKIKKSFPLDPDKQRRFFESLDKIFFQKTSQNFSSRKSIEKRVTQSALWGNGLFFALLFIIIITGIGVLSKNVSPWILPIVLVASILLYAIIGAFVLRTQGDSGISQKNFVALISEALKLVPLLKKEDNSNSEHIVEKNNE